MIGVGVVVAIIVLAASATTSIRSTVDKGFVGDFVVASNAGFSGGLSPEVAAALTQQPELAVVTEVRQTPAQVNGSGTFLPGVDPATFGEIADPGVTAGSLSDLAQVGTIGVDDADREGQGLGDR